MYVWKNRNMYIRENMKLEGYHNTEASRVEDIFRNGFICKPNKKHWLGQGIYFFADVDTAIDNVDMLKHEDEIKTIAVEIDVEDSAYLDLDIGKNNNFFRRYCINKEKALKEMGLELIIDETDKRQAALIYKCFFMDLFKQENGYAVLSKTFPKDSPPYAEKNESIKYLGLPFLEKYICVNNNKYIVNKSVIEREWLI